MCMLNQSGAEKILFDLINKGVSEGDCAVMLAGLRGIAMDGVNLGSTYCAPYTRARCLPLRHYLHESDEATKENNDKYVAMLDDIVASAATNTYNSSSNSNPVRCWEGAKRLALDCVTDIESYKTRLSEFLKPYIMRTIPAVISILKSIYQYYPADSVRVTSIADLLHKWESEVEAGTFSTPVNPTHTLWVWQALSAHYMRVGNFAKATEYVDKAIAHTPTMEQLYLLKAKICRRESKLLEAAELAEKARVMDLQDRYLNVKATKYWLRVGDVERAENVFQLFLKASVNPNDAYLTAYETQCTWFERELGDAFINTASYDVGAEMIYGEKALLTRPRAFQKNSNDVLSALQNYTMFEHHHQDNHEELIDFHNYTFRRSNMRQFVDVQLTNHNLATQNMFLRVCPRIVRALMKVAVDGAEAIKSRHVSRPPPNDHHTVVDAVPLEDAEKEKERLDDIKRRGDLYTNAYHKDYDLEEPLKRARPYVDALLTFQGAQASTQELAIEYFLLCQEKDGSGYSVPLIKSLKALKAIPPNENIIICPITSSFSCASVLKDADFMEAAFGLNTRRAGGSTRGGGAATSRIAMSRIPSVFAFEGEGKGSSSLGDIDGVSNCPIRERIGNSAVRKGQMMMALYMVTKLLDAQVRDAVVKTLKERSGDADATTTEEYVKRIGTATSAPDDWVRYFRFFPIPGSEGNFDEFTTIMSNLVMRGREGEECVNFLMERYAGSGELMREAKYYEGPDGKIVGDLKLSELLGTENQAKDLLIWALSMVFSRGTVVDHPKTLEQCFGDVTYPLNSEKFFAPDGTSEYGSVGDGNTPTKMCPREKMISVLCPLMDLCNHTTDPTRENAAVCVPEAGVEEGGTTISTRVVCLRSLKYIPAGEEIVMTYGVGERELGIFYGMRPLAK